MTTRARPQHCTLLIAALIMNSLGCAGVAVDRGTPSAPLARTSSVSGIWISKAELMSRPTSGAPWEAVLADAQANRGIADISDQDSSHDMTTYAQALVCARTGQLCSQARANVIAAMGTEQKGRWLAVGRNMLGYVIAADLLNLRADGNPASEGSRVDAWVRSFLTMRLAQNNTGEAVMLTPFGSGSNASAQEGAVFIAVARYAGNTAAVQRGWDAFRTYSCDPTAPNREDINVSQGVAHNWAHDNLKPCAVNPLGTSKTVPDGYPGAGRNVRIDGAIINDMRRGDFFQWPPVWTAYPWVGLEGYVPAALLLNRAGYPAFEIANRSVLRTIEYLWFLRNETGDVRWFDGRRADETVHLVNVMYGTSYPTQPATGGGRIMGYTDWTHP